MLTDIELKVSKVILDDDCIPSGEVRKLLKSSNRIILTKANFPNIRHLLYSYMTSFHPGHYRGGQAWVCVIATKDRELFEKEIMELKI